MKVTTTNQKQHNFMTMYTSETFQKKRVKGERLAFTKVALPSSDVDTSEEKRDILLTGLTHKHHCNPLHFEYKRDSEFIAQERTYAFFRFNEFLSNTCHILNRRLTPGFAKDGRVHLVGIDWRLLDRFFCQFKCNKTHKTFHPTVDRKRVDVTYYYYEFRELPDLGVTDWWIKRHHPNDEFKNYSESFYTKLKFGVCTETNRVWVDYWQTTSSEQGFITA